jgi:NAD(P)H dehydrogenase (quinone)
MRTKNILIVYAHPEPQSMNGSLFQTAIETFQKMGHQVQTTDLYHQAFHPTSGRANFSSVKDAAFYKQQVEEIYAGEVNGFVPELEEEMKKIEACDLMIWQFPLWWYSVPAILKGWVDRVFAIGRAYGQGQMYETGVFKGKKALLSLTTGSGPEKYLPDGFEGDIMGILRPVHRGILQFTGFTVLAPHITYSPARKSKQELEAELQAYANRLTHIWEEPAFDVGRY